MKERIERLSLSDWSCECSFQLVGLACLRAAMGDAVPRRSPRLRRPSEHSLTTKLMDPLRFSDISDRTYTVEQVGLTALHS